jgi:hypothetical protein
MHNLSKEWRSQVDIKAEIATSDGVVIAGCTIKHISAREAKLHLNSKSALPSNLILIIAGRNIAWPCQLADRNNEEVAVVFR